LPDPGNPTSSTILGLNIPSANRPLYLTEGPRRADKVLGKLVISFKKFLALDDAADSPARLAWLILEGVACNAVVAEPAERDEFQVSIRQIVTRMEQSTTPAGTLVLAGEAIKSIETYNRGVQRALGSRMTELQSIVSMFTRSMLHVSKSSASSATKLRSLGREIEKTSQTDDLRALKTQLEVSLGTICEEATEQQQRSQQIGDQLRETMNRPEAAAILSEAVGDLDLVTGLPNFRAAEQAIRAAIAANTATYAVLLCVDRVEVINSRFGFAIGDRILMLFGQHLAQKLSNNDRLYRWGTGFLALLDRNGPEISVRAEIARMVSARLEEQIDLGGRSVLLPIAASWMLTSLAGATLEKISQKLDSFTTGQSGGSANQK
jgi:GGDEF domain-containing protein